MWEPSRTLGIRNDNKGSMGQKKQGLQRAMGSLIFQGDHFENLPNLELLELLKIQTASVLDLLCRGIGAGPEAALGKPYSPFCGQGLLV